MRWYPITARVPKLLREPYNRDTLFLCTRTSLKPDPTHTPHQLLPLHCSGRCRPAGCLPAPLATRPIVTPSHSPTIGRIVLSIAALQTHCQCVGVLGEQRLLQWLCHYITAVILARNPLHPDTSLLDQVAHQMVLDVNVSGMLAAFLRLA